MLAVASIICMMKPMPLMRSDMGHAEPLACIARIRKGQAFKSPPHPNKRPGMVTGIVSLRSVNGGAPCERLHGIASLPTAKRKLDVGRNRDWPIKNQQSVTLNRDGRVYKRRNGSEGYRNSFPTMEYLGHQNAL